MLASEMHRSLLKSPHVSIAGFELFCYQRASKIFQMKIMLMISLPCSYATGALNLFCCLIGG